MKEAIIWFGLFLLSPVFVAILFYAFAYIVWMFNFLVEPLFRKLK